MPRVLILSPALLLAACQTAEPDVPFIPPLDACPPSAMAALEPRPAEVAVTEQEDETLAVFGIRTLGADRFADRELSTAQGKARTRRLETRIEQTRAWCAERRSEPS